MRADSKSHQKPIVTSQFGLAEDRWWLKLTPKVAHFYPIARITRLYCGSLNKSSIAGKPKRKIIHHT